MQNRIQQIAHILIHSAYGQSHEALLLQAKAIIIDHKNISKVMESMFTSEEAFIMISKLLIQAMRSKQFVPQIFAFEQEIIQDEEGIDNNIERTLRIEEYRENVFKVIIQYQLKFWVSKKQHKKMVENYITDLCSLCLRLLMIQKQDYKYFTWFIGRCMKSLTNQFTSEILIQQKMLLLIALPILKSFIKEAVRIRHQFFCITRQSIQRFDETYVKSIFISALRYFQVFMVIKKKGQQKQEDTLILIKNLQLISEILKFHTKSRFNFVEEYLNQSLSFPVFLNHLWSDQNILEDLCLLCSPLIKIPCLPNNLLEIASLILSILSTIPKINPPYQFGELRLLYQNRIFGLVKTILINLKNYNEQCTREVLMMCCEIVERKNTSISKENLHQMFDYFGQLACMCVQKCDMNPQDKSIPLAFRVVRRIQYIINKNQCSSSLKLLLIFLRRILDSNVNPEESGFEPRQQLNLILQWIRDVMQDISLTNYPELFKFLLSIDLNLVPKNSLKLWIPCITLILFNSKKRRDNISQQHIQLVLRYHLFLQRNYNQINILFFVRQLVQYLLLDFDFGVSMTDMWNKLKQKLNLHFFDFICKILSKLFEVLFQPCQQTIDYTLEILFEFYKKLFSDKDNYSFQKYIDVCRGFLLQMQKSVFNQKEYFSKRRNFMRIVSFIQFNNQAQELDISKPLIFYRQFVSVNVFNNPSIDNFQRLIYDATGILLSLENDNSSPVIIDYIVDDLCYFYDKYVNLLNLQQNDSQMMKSLLYLFSAIHPFQSFLTSFTRSKIHQKVSRIISYFIKDGYSKKVFSLFKIYLNFNNVSPIVLLPPQPSQYRKYEMNQCIKDQIQKEHSKLIQMYFQNIRRVVNLQLLRAYVGTNVEYLSKYWNESMRRNLSCNGFDFCLLFNNKIWRNRKELQLLGRIMYRSGAYKDMKQLSGLQVKTQDMFIKQLLKQYY